MAGPIYLPQSPSPLAGIGDTLIAALAAKEGIKVRQQELKLKQEEQAAKEAEKQARIEEQRGQAMAQLAPIMAALQRGMPVLPSMYGPVQNTMATPQGINTLQASPVAQQFAQTMNQPGMTPTAQMAAAPVLAQAFAKEKEKRDEQESFDKMVAIASPLWTPEEQAGMKAWRQGKLAGLPEGVLESLRPATAMQKAQLVELNLKNKAAKSHMEADEASTKWLVDNGILQPGGTMKDAAQWTADLEKQERAQAHERRMAVEKFQMENVSKVLENDAMKVAIESGTTDPKAIEAQLRAMYPNLKGGQLTKAAVDGSTAIRKMNAPATETQGKYRLVYAPAKAAQQTIKDLYSKGVVWTKDMDAAVSDWGYVGKAGAGDFLRRTAKGRLSEDETKLLSAVILLTEARLRPTSGATLNATEIQNTRDAFVPQENITPRGGVAPDAGEYKLSRLDEYMESLRQNAGVEDDSNSVALQAARVILNNQRASPAARPQQKPRSAGKR